MSENTIVKRIKLKRKEQGLTQQEFADKIDVSLMTVVRWENGTRTPNTSIMPSIAEALNTSVGYLMGLDDNPNSLTGNEEYLKTIQIKEQTDKEYSHKYSSADIKDNVLYFRNGNKEVRLPDNEFNRPLFLQIIGKMLVNSLNETPDYLIAQDNNMGDNYDVIKH